MADAGRWKRVLWLLAMGSAGWANAAALPPNWQVVPTDPGAVENGLPSVLRSSQLAREGKRLAQVQMVVDLPYAQVLPVVQATLKPLGTVAGEDNHNLVARIGQGWGDVLLARRPELTRDYLRRYALPELQQYVSDGALLESEIPGRMARLERQFRFEGHGERMPDLQQPFSYWDGRITQRHGAMGRSTSTLNVRVTQLDAVMGQPATAVTVWRSDDWPNPGGGVVGQLRAGAGVQPDIRGIERAARGTHAHRYRCLGVDRGGAAAGHDRRATAQAARRRCGNARCQGRAAHRAGGLAQDL
jgi:hypothetical protein